MHRGDENDESPSHIDMVGTNFTAIFHAQSMKFVEPVRNGLSIPAKGQLERVVDALLFFFLLFVL